MTDAPAPGASPQHYGDPSGEQWALEAGRGLVDRPDLGAVAVAGPDRQTWLTSITSQVVTGTGPGDSRELLILSPEGRIEHACAVADDSETTWLVTEADRVDALLGFLDSMRFALRVAPERRDDVAVLASARPRAEEAAVPGPPPGEEALPGHLLTWEDPWPGVTPGGAEYHRGPHPGARTRMRLHLVEADRADDFRAAWLAAAPRRQMSGMLAWEALRIASWRPRVGVDTDERTIPAEVDWLRTAVHIDKGCYRGQESVARVLNLGRPPRRLVYLQLDGSRSELPEPGQRIEAGGRVVGVVTSSARHADEGPIALALVARSLPADAVLDLDGVSAAQEVIVPVDGKSSAAPDRRPGADLVNPDLRRPGTPAAGGLGGLGAR
ncbi:folate-binding protein [Actinomyces sp. B33]|uniref:CAF17-like 4Fe-4S cluster assembly/insertion protein YgfZ n=1 Tax=Actinomyces sp. B33 TaxID=2942131 RepID=UPI0023426D48|nr:glycine cleavage T C-terminal barrel domain-containing protein [Actinomyces sp. B33]MDC4233495.1 folate-binding protein [Actinomyces sp. B33]